MKRVCVFCGSQVGNSAVFAEAARTLGRELVRRELGLVFGGGHIGLMGVIADAVLADGGEVIGVIPRGLLERELAHPRVEPMHVVGTMHERKALMAQLSDAFIALPGGYGTADEFFEIVTWAQLGLHAKPIGLLNVADFFDPLLAWVDRAIEHGFIRLSHRHLIRLGNTAGGLLDLLEEGPGEPVEDKINFS